MSNEIKCGDRGFVCSLREEGNEGSWHPDGAWGRTLRKFSSDTVNEYTSKASEQVNEFVWRAAFREKKTKLKNVKLNKNKGMTRMGEIPPKTKRCGSNKLKPVEG